MQSPRSFAPLTISNLQASTKLRNMALISNYIPFAPQIHQLYWSDHSMMIKQIKMSSLGANVHNHHHFLIIGSLWIFLSIFAQLKLVLCSNSIHYIHHYCTLEVNKNQNAAFQDNLDALLSDLSKKSSTLKFYNSTAGDNDKKVYGIYHCRGDVTSGVCTDCIESAVKNLKKNCTNNKESIVWYEECMLRYSNRTIDATEEELPWRFWCSVNKVPSDNKDKFNESLSNLMNGLVDKAVGNTTPIYFATGDNKNGRGGTSLYCLMQCTPDISGSDCQRCLKAAISGYQEKCEGRTWAMIFSPSCQVRYGPNLFYGEGMPINSGTGRGKKKSYLAASFVLLYGYLVNIRA